MVFIKRICAWVCRGVKLKIVIAVTMSVAVFTFVAFKVNEIQHKTNRIDSRRKGRIKSIMTDTSNLDSHIDKMNGLLQKVASEEDGLEWQKVQNNFGKPLEIDKVPEIDWKKLDRNEISEKRDSEDHIDRDVNPKNVAAFVDNSHKKDVKALLAAFNSHMHRNRSNIEGKLGSIEKVVESKLPKDVSEKVVIKNIENDNKNSDPVPNRKNIQKNNIPLCYDVHVFYYPWYGNPNFDQKYIHWNHRYLPHWNPQVARMYSQNVHVPPEDIGSSYYPELGPYSSRDPKIIKSHMQQISAAKIGVIVVSYYPPGKSDDNGVDWQDLFPTLLNAANDHGIKVAFHIEPYKERSPESVKNDLLDIVTRYSKHPAFYSIKKNNKMLPVVYVYDSYQIEAEDWKRVLRPEGTHTIRGTALDAVVIGLVVSEKHMKDIADAGFNGLYTYFAAEGFTFGSTRRNWKHLNVFSKKNNLLFIPSVGPGYNDVMVRPWNSQNTRHRLKGKYYEESWKAAIVEKPRFVSITSFNEWHEGTQIEQAVPFRNKHFKYYDYLPHGSNFYLELTKKFVEHYENVKPEVF